MPKIPFSKITELVKSPAFFESFRLNYGSYAAAGRELRIPPKVLEELANAPRGYKASDVRVKQVQKAISRMSGGKYQAAQRFIYAKGGMTPAQLEFAKKYSAKGEVGQRYFRKATNQYYVGKTKRVLMPAIGPGGKIVNSPKMQKKAKETRYVNAKYAAKATKKSAAKFKRQIAQERKENRRAVRRRRR